MARSHNHIEELTKCKHILSYCEKCDAAYCTTCGAEASFSHRGFAEQAKPWKVTFENTSAGLPVVGTSKTVPEKEAFLIGAAQYDHRDLHKNQGQSDSVTGAMGSYNG